MKEEQFSNSIAAQSLFINESRCCVIVELYLEVEDFDQLVWGFARFARSPIIIEKKKNPAIYLLDVFLKR